MKVKTARFSYSSPAAVRRAFLSAVALAVGLLAMAVPVAQAAASGFQDKDVSGMYSFVQEGEFVQVTMETEAGHEPRVTGFVSRYGQDDSDKGLFLDQFFSKAALKDDDLSFTTKPVHGIWFEFKGKIAADSQKKPGEQGALRITGTLTQYNTGDDNQSHGKSREIVFSSFPRDDAPAP